MAPVAPPVAPPMAPVAPHNPYGGGFVPKSATPVGSAVQTAIQAGAAIAMASPVAGAAMAASPSPSASPAVVEAAIQAGAAIAMASPIAGAALVAPYGGGMVKPPMKFEHKGEGGGGGGGGSYDLPPRPPRLGRQPTISVQLYDELLTPDNVVLFNRALFENIRSFDIEDERPAPDSPPPHRFLQTKTTGHYATFDVKPYDADKRTHLTLHRSSPEYATKRIGALHVRFNYEPAGEDWPYRRILLYDNGQEITIEIDRNNGYKGTDDKAVVIERIANEVIAAIMQYYRVTGRVIKRL
jgi:hypothetical protein